MKALSLWQPWASAIFVPNLKPIETRHWSTEYRGPVAIHAAKKSNGELVRFYNEKRNRPENAAHFFKAGINSYSQLPLGYIVGIVDLVDCLATSKIKAEVNAENAHIFSPFCAPNFWPTVNTWGDFSPNRFGWCFKNIRRLVDPVPFKGLQGLFTLPDVMLLVLANCRKELVTP
jgi:hypothetical protein